MMTYATLNETVINLSELTDQERAWLGKILEAYADNISYPDFINLVYEPGTPLLPGRFVTEEIMATPLYRAARDLQARLGIRQGWVAPNADSRPDVPPLETDEEVSVTAVMETKGISRAAVIKAVRRGDLIGEKRGRDWWISKRSLDHYQPMAVRIESGRRAREQH